MHTLDAPHCSVQEMHLEKVFAVGGLMTFWQQLQHQVLYKPDSTHEQLEEDVQGIQGLEALFSLTALDPIQHEPQVQFQNEIPIY